MTLGEKIKLRRNVLELSQVELTKKSDVGQSYISELENGKFNYAAKGEEGRNKIAIAMSHIARKKAIKEAAKAYIACKHHEKILIELAESKSRIAYTINTRIIFLCSS